MTVCDFKMNCLKLYYGDFVTWNPDAFTDNKRDKTLPGKSGI